MQSTDADNPTRPSSPPTQLWPKPRRPCASASRSRRCAPGGIRSAARVRAARASNSIPACWPWSIPAREPQVCWRNERWRVIVVFRVGSFSASHEALRR